MAIFVHTSLLSTIGLMITGATAVISRATSANSRQIAKWRLVAGWIATVAVLCGPALASAKFTFDAYYACIAGLIAVALFITPRLKADPGSAASWDKLGLTWAFIGAAIWLVASFLQCLVASFHLALLLTVALLVFSRSRFKMRPIGIQLSNTLILLLIVLPAVDLFRRVHSQDEMFTDPAKYYTYEAGRKDRASYGRWMRYSQEQWRLLCEQIMEPDPEYPVPLRLRRNSHGTLFHSAININSQGFRGPEIPAGKANTYRIVALGESTTFGVTMMPDDKPWPEMLEAMIRDRLKLTRPVEVINGGIPSYSLTANLMRYQRDILPVKPDMIISYHGYNGFRMINGSLPTPAAKPPPKYVPRPLVILGDFEFALKLARYKKRLLPQPLKLRAAIGDPMKSEYARQYEQLIGIARTNHIRLVLADYSMAVNSQSDPDVIEFYRATDPWVNDQIKANEIHTEIVQGLGKLYPEVTVVDTHPNFDGQHTNFIDLVHFTHGGEQHIAELFFAAIKNILQQDCSAQDPPKQK
jgi:lysophospholipase L1-like esterase